jgi:hypothetical protein
MDLGIVGSDLLRLLRQLIARENPILDAGVDD